MYTWKKRLLAAILAGCMSIGLMTPALAVEGEGTDPTTTPEVTTSVAPTDEVDPGFSVDPTTEPTAEPTEEPAETPAETPTTEVTETPTETPSSEPTETPAETPSSEPTETPAETPTTEPTETPAETPTTEPTESPEITDIPEETIPGGGDPGFTMPDYANMSVEELYAAVKDMSAEDRAIVYSLLTEEQIAALEAYEQQQAQVTPPVAVDYESMSNAELVEYLKPLDQFEVSDILISLSPEKMTDFYYYLLGLPEVKEILAEAETEKEDTTPQGVVPFTDAAPLASLMENSTVGFQRKMAPALMSFVSLLNNDIPGNAPDGLVMNKSVDSLDDDQYMITLESYATGDVTIEEEPVPLDIVLVLDQSGSMEDDIEYPYPSKISWGRQFVIWWGGLSNVDAYNRAQADNLFININGKLIPVEVSKDEHTLLGTGYMAYIYSYTDDNGTHTLECRRSMIAGSEVADHSRPTNWDLYTDYGTVSRLTALQDVVEKFVNSVGQDAEDNNITHRVAVVGFASGSSDYTNTELFVGGTTYNYTRASGQYGEALQAVDTEDGLQNLFDSIAALDAEGGTHPSYGLEMANGILNARTDAEGRKSVIIVFTDGEPGDYGFDSDEASDAIEEAHTAKQGGTTIYTVGIFDGANPNDVSSNGNKFMNATSSNYPNATSFSDIGGRVANGYYLTASNGNELEEVFENISESIGTTPVTLNANSVIKDVLTQEFNITEGQSVTAKIVKCTAVDDNGAPTAWDTTGQDVASDKIRAVGKTISVTGFDFAANYVGKHPEAGNYGSKLVIQIPITVDRSVTFGGNGIYTNESNSGIYSDANQESPTGTFNRPTVDVPIQYEINGSVKYVCVGTSTSRADLIQYVEGYQPDGTNNAYVNITYTLKQGEVTIGTYTIYAGNRVGTWSWAEGYDEQTADMTECAMYTLTCEVAPATLGSVTTVTPSPSVAPAIHVIAPTITWNDSVEEIGAVVNLNNNGGSAEWKDVTPGHNEVPREVEKPQLTYAFKVGDKTVADPTSYEVTAETPVDVTVTVNGVDITEYVTFMRQCDSTLGDAGDHLGSETECEFVIHLNNIELSITKTVDEKPEQSFIFTVIGPSGTMTIAMGADKFTYDETSKKWTCTKTITGLKSGEYTVTEDTGWSWMYKVTAGSAIKEAEQGDDGNLSVTFDNTRSDKNWLGGSHSVENEFNSAKGGSNTLSLNELNPAAQATYPRNSSESTSGNDDDKNKDQNTEPDPSEPMETQEGGVSNV